MSIHKMNVTSNTTSFNNQGGNCCLQGRYTKNYKEKSQVKNGNIFAGNLTIGNQNTKLDQKVQAEKQALRKIISQFSKDQEIDGVVTEKKEHQMQLKEEAAIAQREIERIKELRSELKDSYGIQDDDQEQKDLELLEKSMKPSVILTEEEYTQLSNMGSLTEYQKASLELQSASPIWEKRKENANNVVAMEGKNIAAIRLEELKYHPMVDAQKEAQKIMNDASQGVVQAIIDDTKDQLVENLDQKKEEAENETKEHSNGEVASRDNLSEDGQEPTSLDQLQEADEELKKLQGELKAKISNHKILLEDIKGIVVDDLV